MFVKPSMNKVEIEGQNEIVLSRNPEAIKYDLSTKSNVQVCFKHFIIHGLFQETRIGRFFAAMKIVWKFCK